MMRLLIAALAWWSLSAPAHAYIDPGSAMLILQGLLAAIGGVMLFVRHPIQTAKKWMNRLRNRPDA
jgi:hypothetical protein